MKIEYKGRTATVTLTGREHKYRSNGLIQFLSHLCDDIEWVIIDYLDTANVQIASEENNG